MQTNKFRPSFSGKRRRTILHSLRKNTRAVCVQPPSDLRMLTHVSMRLPSPFRTRERKLFRAAISLLEYLQHVLHRRFSSFSMSREQKVVRRLIESIRFSIAHSLFHSLFFTCSCHFLFLPSFLTTNELGVNAPVVVVYLRKAARNLHATSHLSAFVCSFESAPPEIQSEGKVPLSPWPLPCQEFQPRSTFFPTGWARPALQLVVAALRPFSAKFSRRGQIGATIKN